MNAYIGSETTYGVDGSEYGCEVLIFAPNRKKARRIWRNATENGAAEDEGIPECNEAELSRLKKVPASDAEILSKYISTYGGKWLADKRNGKK